MAAYRSGDCYGAWPRLQRAATLFRPILGTDAGRAAAGLAECNLLILAQSAWERGEYTDALIGYDAYLDLYPAGELRAAAREAAAEATVEWGTQLRESGDLQAAIETYWLALARFPRTDAGRQTPGLIAEAHTARATALRGEGNHRAAIAECQAVLDRYPRTEAAELAAALITEAYAEWAMALREEGNYEAAAARYHVLLSATPEQFEAVSALAAETYAEQANRLLEAGRRTEALQWTYALLARFPDEDAADQARAALGALSEEAVHALAAGASCEALSLFRDLLEVDISTAAEVEAAMPRALHECARKKLAEGACQELAALCEELLRRYPSTVLAEEARFALVAAYVAGVGEGNGGLPQPQCFGNVPTRAALLVIANDLPMRLEFLFAGPESRTVVVEACNHCLDGEPRHCQEGPEVTIGLPPGEYGVLLREADRAGATPLVGSWTLRGGSGYFFCATLDAGSEPE
jgi:tetratricopeptide (TPR) repeat protein